MSTIPSRHELTVYADYHQFYVLDAGAALDATGHPDFWTREAFVRMLAVNPGIIGISTESGGEVRVTLHVEGTAPALDLAAWDHVVEAGLDVSTGRLIVCGCTQPREEGLQVQVAPGRYRARVCSGRLESVVDEQGDDHYAVFLWPADLPRVDADLSGVDVVKQWPKRRHPGPA
jgi:hypothetical protein